MHLSLPREFYIEQQQESVIKLIRVQIAAIIYFCITKINIKQIPKRNYSVLIQIVLSIITVFVLRHFFANYALKYIPNNVFSIFSFYVRLSMNGIIIETLNCVKMLLEGSRETDKTLKNSFLNGLIFKQLFFLFIQKL